MWSVPRMWPGDTCAVLASGSSMTQEVADTVRAAGIRAIAVNTTFQLAPWADLLYAADETWWKVWWRNREGNASDFPGLKVMCTPLAMPTMCAPFPGIRVLKSTGRDGFDEDPANVRTGGNSGYQAIHVATHAGCSRILLCGFDMHGGHWHGRHPEPLREHGNDYSAWFPLFAKLWTELQQRGIEVLNCTSRSALKCFPMADLKDALARSVLAA